MSIPRLTASGRCSACGRLQTRFDTDLQGRVVEIPEPCACMRAAQKPRGRKWAITVDDARRLACICQRCDLPTAGKPKVSLYCEAHRIEARAETFARHKAKVGNKHEAAYRDRHREKLRRRARAQARREREKRAEYKRAWRKRNRDKVRAQKERAALRAWKKPDAYEYHRRYRQEVAAGTRQPKRARRNLRGERLCLTVDCHAVMSGYARKCEACKQRDAKQAAEALGQLRRVA